MNKIYFFTVTWFFLSTLITKGGTFCTQLREEKKNFSQINYRLHQKVKTKLQKNSYRWPEFYLGPLFNKISFKSSQKEKKILKKIHQTPPRVQDSLGIQALQEIVQFEKLGLKKIRYHSEQLAHITQFSSIKELKQLYQLSQEAEKIYESRIQCRLEDRRHRIERANELPGVLFVNKTDVLNFSKKNSKEQFLFKLLHERYTQKFNQYEKKPELSKRNSLF